MSLIDKLEALSDEELAEFVAIQEKLKELGPEWKPLPHQIPPEGNDWYLWLLLAGRGAGKTDACANYVNKHVMGPPCFKNGHRIAIIAPTLSDGVDACVNGPSGLKAHNPNIKLVQALGGTMVKWPDGSEAKLFGAHNPDDVERLRAGGNRCLAWLEELAAWRYLEESYQHMRYGLRLGPRPHAVASTTPKPRKALMKLMEDPTTVVTGASTDQNPHLDSSVKAALFSDYGQTRLGRQELYAELLTDVPGAIATLAQLDACRVKTAPEHTRTLVSVDPAVTNTEVSDETGIAIQRVGIDGHCYMIDDWSCKVSVDQWAERAVTAAIRYEAGLILYEKNQGADAIGSILATALSNAGRSDIKLEDVVASQSKFDRALALQQWIEQSRWHIVGRFPELEEQLTTFTADYKVSGSSPDRLDAVVHGFRRLMLEKPKPQLRFRAS